MKILFTNADLLLRRNGAYETLRGAFLGVDGDRIAYIGTDKPEGKYGSVKDMTGKLLMPGLINCHSHIAMTLMRGVGSGLPLHEWLFDSIFPIEDRLVREEVAAASRFALLEMIAGGTTSFSDMYFFPSATVEAVAEAGVKANLNRCVQCFDEAQTVEQNHQIPESLALFEQYHNAENGRIRIDFSIHAEYTCKSRIVRSYSEMCRERGGRMHLHLAETAREQQECIERYGKTPAEWFESLGTFDSPTAAAHCVAVTESDMDVLRAHGVSVVHNPTSNLKLGSGFAPIRRMIDKGINVTLGTDGVASNNNLNMFEEMHLADIIHDGYHNDPTHIKSAEVLDMATVNGAKLQGRDDTGVLEVGKKADIIAVDLTKPHLYPNFDTLALLTCSAQAGDVCMTMADGRILYENGVFLTLDAEKVISDMKAAVARLYR
ncbi:MAG: amidohydrolase [Oscillospiraceae bacterium]|nr:amidohydrolase [Oscillospiraceae bacterium]